MKASETRDMEVVGAKQVVLKLVLLMEDIFINFCLDFLLMLPLLPMSSKLMPKEDSADNKDSFLPQDDLSSVLTED